MLQPKTKANNIEKNLTYELKIIPKYINRANITL